MTTATYYNLIINESIQHKAIHIFLVLPEKQLSFC